MLSEIFLFKNSADLVKNNSSWSFSMHIRILYGAKMDLKLLSEIVNTFCICAVKPVFILK